MQFKHPEILYVLFALIIPILVHLFQLQKFKKVVFTNVAFLKKIDLQTRKSSQLKKWLILTSRMLLFTAIIFAFSQPYFSTKNTAQNIHNSIYLDNSISLNSIGKKGKLLQVAAQEIIENVSDEHSYSFLTNSDFYRNVTATELKNILKKVDFTTKNLSIQEVLLKIESEKLNKTNSLNSITLISDFQNNKKIKNNEFTNVTVPISLIKTAAELKNNISIDSIFISNKNERNFTLNVVLKNQGPEKTNVPISIFNDTKLISKRSFSIENDTKKTIDFEIQNQSHFRGRIKIQNNDVFLFDNDFFFTVNFGEKINVLSIGKNNDYLQNIFTDDVFVFNQVSSSKINYNIVPKQQLILLNEMDDIPSTLSNALTDFVNNGGSLVVIPSISATINSYNSFFSRMNIGKISKNQQDSLKITKIHYDHPLFKNVFTKQVRNFQFPRVISSFNATFKGTPLLSFENNQSFLSNLTVGNGELYWFSGALSTVNSNFTNSPLIVPTLYNIGQSSLQTSKPYYRLQERNTIEINASIGKDQVVSIQNLRSSFIPLQQNSQNKISILTTDKPDKKGFYQIVSKDTLQTISYNNPSSESMVDFMNINELSSQNSNITSYDSIASYFEEENQKNEVQWLWKLFLALAIVSLLLEILILKFFKT
ncbi:BatA domain-containing protein [Flavobacteriaceae bacterium S356]|uniref:BatA domain-containing protein n=1 Tax=Asprobacillus argus TaxID=3076534 RepID=A0ABU3LHL4_9FLAO|nr:BatA domain-containing protein [Flavobacteriaceae bacterium S356]